MGNNSSSHQHAVSQHEMGRGWTQSFPRELTRHHNNHSKQPPGHKVLPEPPNQRLRATNNGSIIHNGGTISGRRPSALTLPHDLNKQGVYRSRSTSASNVGVSRGGTSRDHVNHHQNCCNGHYRGCNNGGNCRENEMMEIKRFGSEPDLRYSPTEPRRHSDTRHSGYYPERESRYRGKKKYKAPPPPTNGDGSSPDSYKWEICGQDHREQRENCHQDEDNIVQPPPRKSRLFKTRAETKRQANNNNNNNNNSGNNNWLGSSLQQESDSILDSERRWRSENRASGKENRPVWREYHEQDRWSREERRRSKKFDGKNTLQRSLSSPEFQAELMQVARKVRNKLNYNGRVGPVGASSAAVVTLASKERDLQNSKSMTSIDTLSRINEERVGKVKKSKNIEDSFGNRREEIRSSARFYEEKKFQERGRGENRVIRSHQEVHSYEERRMSSPRDQEKINERQVEHVQRRREFIEDDGVVLRKPMNGHFMERSKTTEPIGKSRRSLDELGRTRSESPAPRNCRDKVDRMDVRGQGSGRESTPEPPRGKEKKVADSRRRKRTDLKNENCKDSGKRWSEVNLRVEKSHVKRCDENIIHQESREIVEENWNFNNGLSPNANRIHSQEYKSTSHQVDEGKIQNEDIALKLRPTLPKKQLEIPRFSPSAAWRLLSALETPGPNMSTASEEVPVMYEERIERSPRPPPPLIVLGPRSSHDKSGDSGISGDAGAPNDDSLDISTNQIKNQATRPTWTPQQDLGEESSSDAGVDSPPPIPPSSKFPPRAHVFSLSLPRDDNRHSVYIMDKTSKEVQSFNSLQKIKRSVTGAFGLGSGELEKKRPGEVLDDNWLLSTSAPTSLQHSQVNQGGQRGSGENSPEWGTNYAVENFGDGILDEPDEKPDFPMAMKPPSFSYLASGGHVMYLPSTNDTEQRTQSLNYRNSAGEIGNRTNKSDMKNSMSGQIKISSRNGIINSSIDNGFNSRMALDKPREFAIYRERSFTSLGNKDRSNKSSNFSKSCENISEMKQRSYSPVNGPENLQDKKNDLSNIKIKPNPKGKRFTFQSTVRQIERRRLAEKLSREAEAKERQRKSELEAMRKVEEEFQRKRAKEKANIRQQLRLYSMDENSTSLPPFFDSTNLSRADPDGAPSSSGSSPTSAPPGKINTNRKSSVSSDEYHRKKEERYRIQQQQHQQPREYKDYRSKYFDWAPSTESSSHLEVKQTTVHPKIVCDIPKSSHAFVDTNGHAAKPANSNSTPRSDNYRKDFAHGAVAARSSLAGSDSELSQPNTRPHSRQNGNKNTKPVRTREEKSVTADSEHGGKPSLTRPASSTRSSEAASSEEEAPVEPVKQRRNNVNLPKGFIFNGIQPFVREKSYRPITFNSQPVPS